MKIDSVGRETGRPVDRVGERIGPVSLVSRYTGLPPTIFIGIGARPRAVPAMETIFVTVGFPRRFPFQKRGD
ncbi:MAG TPA: hypothetical protein ENK60_03170 [Anaerolineae bacterium]|nr:hypothetical protein [Anaerolineae bacterium]